MNDNFVIHLRLVALSKHHKIVYKILETHALLLKNFKTGPWTYFITAQAMKLLADKS